MTVQVDVSLEADVPGLEPGAAERLVERAVRATLADRDVAHAELSVTLLPDPAMTALNREWKGRDVPTDVLAFSLYEVGEAPVGDVYVGADRAAEQGASAGESVERELARLTIHATLHVLGLDHPEVDRESSDMWGHQERILDTLDLR
jgi:probable rRNA maturation factor